MNFKKIEALAFAPLGFVEKAFKMIAASVPPEMNQFITYIEENYVLGWIKKRKSDGTLVRNKPTFSPELWNVNQRVLQHQPRTTNKLEG